MSYDKLLWLQYEKSHDINGDDQTPQGIVVNEIGDPVGNLPTAHDVHGIFEFFLAF